jgi:hypothetical protein
MTPLEHRLDARLQTAHSVLLIVSGDYAIPARIRNVSRHGLYVEAEVPLPRNSLVQVQISQPGAKPDRLVRLATYVVHTTERGAGLLLTSENPDDVQVLTQMFKNATEWSVRIGHVAVG